MRVVALLSFLLFPLIQFKLPRDASDASSAFVTL